MSDPYTPPYGPSQPVGETGPPAPSRTPWIVGAAVVGVILLAGVTVLLFAVGAFDAKDTGGVPAASEQPTKVTDAPASSGTDHAFVDDICARLDFSGFQALGDLASGYEDRSADYGSATAPSATLGCDMDFGDGGELRVGGSLGTVEKTVENWDFAKGLLRGRVQEAVPGEWEEGVVGVDDTWGPGKTDAIIAVRDGNLVVTVAFYSINDDVGYEKVKSLLPAMAASVLAAATG